MAPTLSKQTIAAIVVTTLNDEIRLKKKRKWCKNWLLQRRLYTHMNLLKHLQTSEPSDFRNYLRMDNDAFKEAISAEERLTITLRYLATDNSYEDLKFSTAISPQCIGKIVPETSWAIYETLKQEYLQLPSSPEEWKKVACDFKNKWQFENCLGAMDGKHILIKKPSNSGSYYFNYKGTFSVVLFAIVNANYEFLYVHTGTNGRVSDGGIWNNTGICKRLKRLFLIHQISFLSYSLVMRHFH
nr:unnamed protein product [Callosobruchus analis]